MLIRSQDGSVLVTLGNGILVENGLSVMYQTIPNGPYYELGKYPGENSSDRRKTQKVLKSIFDLHANTTYQMPQAKDVVI